MAVQLLHVSTIRVNVRYLRHLSPSPPSVSLPNDEGQLSSSSTATATNDIPEPLHDQKQTSDIIIDWDNPQDPDNPKKSVHLY